MGNCADHLKVHRMDSIDGKYTPAKSPQKKDTHSPTKVSNTGPRVSSLKEILKTTQQNKKKKDSEDNIKKNGRQEKAIPTIHLDQQALTVKTPEIPTFDYTALMMK